MDRITASRRRITYARVCVEVSGALDLIEKFAIETEDGNGNSTLLDIDVEYQWKPTRCSKCSTFGHDCHTVAKQRPDLVNHKSNPYAAGHPILKHNRNNSTKDRVWQVVQRKDKGKRICEDSGLGESPRVSPHRCVASDTGFSQEKQVSVVDEHVIYSVIDSSPMCENRTASVQINNSFNALIPYEYDREDDVPIDGCMGNSQDEGTIEKEDIIETINEVEIETVFASPISARQRKREAKMLFSGSRPKGRHRS